MEENEGDTGEIISGYVNQGCDDDNSRNGKKRKFLSGMNKQLSFPASKYICCETIVEDDPFSRESQQSKVFYTYVRKEKTSLDDVDENIGADSAQESDITAVDSFSECSAVKPDGYANTSSYEGPCSSYSSCGAANPRSAYSYFGSTSEGSIATSIGRENSVFPHQDIEFDGNGNCEDQFDEFGHCLGYLVSACDNDSKQEMDEGIDGVLCMSSVSQLSARQPTIDQEFEDYFSMLML